MTTVAVIGGGISGLSAAYHLRQLDPTIDVTVLDAGARPGGVIETTRRDGFVLENAADNFITTSPVAVALCEQLGLADQLIRPNPVGRQAMVLRDGRLLPIPSGFVVMAPSRIWPLITTRVLSLSGKLRAGCEVFIPRRRRAGDESLQSFTCRRFGREMFERLVQPLVGGIYTADPRMLSLAATMPRFMQMEQQYGSLIRGTLKQRRQQPAESGSGARYSQFVTLQGGLSTLVDALAGRLPAGSVRQNAPVCGIQPRAEGGWSIRLARGESTRLDVDGVIVATPAPQAASLLAQVDPIVSRSLSDIPYASCAVVSLGYRREQIGHPLDAFGFVVPLAETRLILSCSFSSIKYAGRAPQGSVLLRVFIGGACQSGLMRLPQDQLVELAERELAQLLSIRGEPILRHVKCQWNGMPQYHVGHCERIAAIESRLAAYPSLALAGSALRGVGVPSCIESGQTAAQCVARQLSGVRRTAAAPI